MHRLEIKSIPGFDEWRQAARQMLQVKIPPNEILWNAENQMPSLLPISNPVDIISPNENAAINVPKVFIEKAQAAICHQDPERFALLYRILWRLSHENKQLLHYQTDDDIIKLNALVKAVRRDAYKIKAFLRFRTYQDALDDSQIGDSQEEHYIAWYEPEHYTLELVLSFFQTRFCNMYWSILTPYRAAHWDKQNLQLVDNPNPELYPKKDAVEQYWLTYYASIFNPARVKVKAMMAQMPKKYWKNMPETVLIESMLHNASHRVSEMLDKSMDRSMKASQVE